MKGPPTILFGAFDRHNFGDLLFPHIAAALLPGRELLFAGLAESDLRACGGHRVTPLTSVAAGLAAHPRAAATLIHAGGEILCCDSWEAAVMLLPPEEAVATISRLDSRPAQRMAWARQRLAAATGDPQTCAPYVASRERFPAIGRVLHIGVGGADLDARDRPLRSEVLAKLASADAIVVRDRLSRTHLEAAGLAARLAPDPAVMTAELFGERIASHGMAGEPARLRAGFARGYLAVQLAAEFGDDEMLGRIALQLDRVAANTGLSMALFRAGAAPWHDSLEVLQRIASRMRNAAVTVFESLDIWDICALIAGSRGFCGSSLHGRILATAFGLPRLNLARSADPAVAAKHRAYAATWELPDLPTVVEVDRLAETLTAALRADPEELARLARRLAESYRSEFETVIASDGRTTSAGQGSAGIAVSSHSARNFP